MGGSADAISAFDYDQLTAIFFLFNPRKRCAIKVVVVNWIWTAFSLDVD